MPTCAGHSRSRSVGCPRGRSGLFILQIGNTATRVACGVLDCAVGIAVVGDGRSACVRYLSGRNYRVEVNAYGRVARSVIVYCIEVPPTVIRCGCRYGIGGRIVGIIASCRGVIIADIVEVGIACGINDLLVGVASA